MKHDNQRRQIVNLDAMRTAKGKPVAVTVPRLICAHGVDLDKERCKRCAKHEAEHDRVFEGERP